MLQPIRNLLTRRKPRRRVSSPRPVGLESLEERLPLDSTVVFSELMYNPGEDQDLEWIELHNQMAVDMDISGWRIDGVDYTFPEGTVLAAGQYTVVAKSPAALLAASGVQDALGPYDGRMDNRGETLRLINNSQRTMDEVAYEDREPWPVGPDGSGASLAKLHPDGGSGHPENWTTSRQVGGTPGARNFADGPQFGQTIVLSSSEQAWSYDDRGTDWGTAWRANDFDVNDPNGDGDPSDAWKSGAGLWGNVDPQSGLQIGTTLELGPTTYYFRSEFTFSGDPAATDLRLNSIADDGAVVYLNGNEVARFNMPEGPIDFQTPASSAIRTGEYTGEIRISAADLQVGPNVLAVEVHQVPLGTPPGEAPPSSVMTISAQPGFTIGWNGKDGEFFDTAAPPRGAIVPSNAALASAGAVAFASSDLGPEIGVPYHITENLNDGFYGNSNSWIGGDTNPFRPVQFAGIRFAQPISIQSIAWGRDNGNNTADACGGQCADRSLGNYTVQYTAVSNPDSNTADTGDAATGWVTIGRVGYRSNQDTQAGGGFTTFLRHEYDVRQNGQPIDATGIRILVPGTGLGGGTAIDEIEVYTTGTVETADVVFGATLTATEILPESPQIVLNEVAGAGAADFFVELANHSEHDIDLTGYTVASSDPAVAGHTLSATVIPAHGLLLLDRARLGFAPAEQDRLYLYGPGGKTIDDAIRVESGPRARSLDHDGRWLVPNATTPGAINSFAIEQDVVINEILYHAPGVAKSPTPATFASTILLPIDDTTLWRFRAQADGLPPDWAVATHTVGQDGWQEGPALIGYERSALAEPVRTELPNPAAISPPIVTYYFEREFEFTGDPADTDTELALQHLIDDGAVFYLNGHEVLRYNLPDGTVDGTTIASPSVNNAIASEPISIPTDYLLQGTNRLSVEVHQASVASNDVVFGVKVLQRRALTPFIPGEPFRESDEEWIELYNRSADRTIDLAGWQVDDAVRFTFAEGTTIGPREYRIVAGNAVEFVAKYPELAGRVVGQFDGQLSNRNEAIRLLDAHGNPADEVHYYDDGRWDHRADGGGSSLELIDASADNAQPEAWSASVESDQLPWQTITYRDVVRPDGFTNGVTTRYHELILGMLDAGSVWIDDVSVIEDPDGAAIERVQNGQFTADALGQTPAHWRIAGNHAGIVTVDPENPGNQVLLLTATGTLEDRLNHAETTFVDNAPLREGVTYEISFRAKWQSGSNQLHSHLYFDRLARTTILERPTRVGTPGSANSRAATNLGPTYGDLSHAPAVPGANEPVTVSVVAADPQGVAELSLWYAVDDGGFQRLPMDPSAAGHYSGVIPGQAPGAVVQFYVEARDLLGAASFFPAAGRQSRALFRVQDQQARNGIHNFRIVMTPGDTRLLHQATNVMSNGRMGATVIYNESEIFYDVGVRLKGSNAGRGNDPYLGFNVTFDPMQLFRGVHDSVAIDRSGRSGPTPLTQDEILIKHIGNHAGDIPYMYDDLVHLIAPNPIHSRSALLMMARYGDEFLDSQFENGSDGTLFRMDIAYVPDRTTDGNPESLKLPFPYSHPQPTKDLADLGDDKELYRSHLLIRNNRDRDDYDPIIAAAKVLSLRGDELAAAAPDVIDVDEWARVFALQSLTGAADVYTRGALHHNIEFYVRPSDGRVLALPWDWDFAFTAATNQSLIGTQGTGGRLMSLPSVRRLVYGHLLDIINTTFNNQYLDRWIDHYGQVAGQNLSSIKNYVAQRSAYVLRVLPDEVPFEITTNGGENFSAGTPTVQLAGRGWINVRQIRIAGTGEVLNVQWLDDENWQALVPLTDGINTIELEAVDHQGQVVGTDSIVIQLTTGDFNVDGQIDARDVDLLAAAIRAGDIRFDLTGDGVTDRADQDYMIHDILHTHLGDANLDGVFNSSDLVLIFQAGEYEDAIPGNSTWAEGDWNGDGEFTTADLVAALQDGAFVAAATLRVP